MKKRKKAAFDPKVFLAMVGEGKTISKYQKDEIVFSQGKEADWPAPGSADTELGVFMGLEVGHGETEVYTRV